MNRTGWYVTGTVALAALAACSEESEELCEIDSPAAATVSIPEMAVAESPIWTIEEVWRAAGPDEGATLTLPTSARVSSDGRLAIPDFALATVWILGPEGQWHEPLGSRGQGPGELQAPIAASWTTDGAVWVADAGQNRFERFDPATGQGTSAEVPDGLLGPVVRSGQVGWFGMKADGTTFIEHPPATPDAAETRFAFGTPGGTETVTAWASSWPEGQLPTYARTVRPEWPRTVLGVGPVGWVVAPRSDRYELIIHDDENQPVLHVCVSGQNPLGQHANGPDTPEHLVEEIAQLARSASTGLFSRIIVDRDERIWIERHLRAVGPSDDQMFGVAGARYDVISPEGQFMARVDLPAGLRLQDAHGESIWAISVGALEEKEVVRGRIEK